MKNLISVKIFQFEKNFKVEKNKNYKNLMIQENVFSRKNNK